MTIIKTLRAFNGTFLVGTGALLVIIVVALIVYLDFHHTQKEAEKKTLRYINWLMKPMRETQRAICRQTLENAEFLGADKIIDTTQLLMFSPAFHDSVLDLIEDFENSRVLLK